MTRFTLSLAGRTAIVTGASGGVGRATVQALADAGASITGTDVVIDGMEKTAAEIKARGGKALAIRADVTRKAEVDNVISETVRTFGTVDILVNNAGIDNFFPLMKLKEEAWDRIMNVNVKGYFLFAQAAGRVMMRQKRGSIIQVSSGAARMANPYSGAYCTSKAAVEHLTHVLAVELGYSNIRVNCIAPGFIDTGMIGSHSGREETLKRYAELVPLQRVAQPDDMAAVILFLASDLASYVNGAVIAVDGGVTLTGYSIEEIARTLPPKYRDLTEIPE